jgi:hypothetical protein
MNTLYLEKVDMFSEQFVAIVDLVAKNGHTRTEVTSLPQKLSLTGRQVEVGKLSTRLYHQKWWWGPGVVGE